MPAASTPAEPIPSTMAAVLLNGHGGTGMLEYRTDIAVPSPGPGDVLIEVRAAGINNTDINTRIGWYSKSVRSATSDGAGIDELDTSDAGWSGTPLSFPRIQGADVCGIIVGTGTGVGEERVGERVLVRPMMSDPASSRPLAFRTLGSEMDGAFAQYVVAPSNEVLAVDSTWSDVDLASIPCAYSTAENMLQRAHVGAERTLITGASGGVGSAAVQLARRRGAEVIAVCSQAKAADVLALGAAATIDRDADVTTELELKSFDVVIDLVGGPAWPSLLQLLRPGGRYVTSGAIAGPLVELDLRTLYLEDLTLLGCTHQPHQVFTDLIGYIERDEIRPVVAATYPLNEIAQAQADFVEKRHVGKLVLVPPPLA
jgi:NADPH:quinone reductase-like Zn-dependent oxidoreductase